MTDAVATPFEHRGARAVIRYFHATLEGRHHIPASGGALLVGNHAMMGLDGVVLGSLVLVHMERRVRFLGERNLWRIPVIRTLLDKAGALPGEPGAATRLLAAGEICGVYPGGIDDSWKSTTTQRYELQWGERRGFARVAMAAGVPIVPVAAFGIDEMYDILARERWVGRRVFGHRRYDLPFFVGWKGTPLPRRHPQRYVCLPPIDTRGDLERPEDVERVRRATYDALDAELAPARRS